MKRLIVVLAGLIGLAFVFLGNRHTTMVDPLEEYYRELGG